MAELPVGLYEAAPPAETRWLQGTTSSAATAQASGRYACRSPPTDRSRAPATGAGSARTPRRCAHGARGDHRRSGPRHARIAMQGDRPLKVVLVPASQRQAVGLDLAHRRTVAGGERGDGRHSLQDIAAGTLARDRVGSFTCVAGPRRHRPLLPAVAAAATATPGSAASSPPPPPPSRASVTRQCDPPPSRERYGRRYRDQDMPMKRTDLARSQWEAVRSPDDTRPCRRRRVR